MQTYVLGTEVVAVEEGVERWGIRNILSMWLAIVLISSYMCNTNTDNAVAIGGDIIEVCQTRGICCSS